MDISLRGNLRDYSLARILIALNRKRATGSLRVTDSGRIKIIYIKDGYPIFASSNVEEDRLGNMLLKAGKINIGQYEKSVEILKKTGRRHGVILVELGYLTPRDLLWGVKYQVANIIYSIFQLEDGEYAFDEEMPPKEVITLKIRMETLVYRSVRRINNWTRISREMPPSDTVFTVNDDASCFCKGIDLNTQDRMVLSLIDGRKTMRQLADKTGLNSFDVIKTLYVLWLTGFITKGKTGAPAETPEDRSKEESALKKKAEEFYERLGGMSKDEILRIDRFSDSEAVKRQYYKMAREFHPDRYYNSKDKELHVKLTTIFNAITEAYNLLKDEARRKDYFNNIKVPGERRKDRQATMVEGQLKRGVGELKKGNFKNASDILKWAVKEDPGNAEAWSYLSRALTHLPGRLKEAETALLEAISLEPFNSRHFSALGNIYLKAGIVGRARQQFEKALKLDPENDEAKNGLEQTI